MVSSDPGSQKSELSGVRQQPSFNQYRRVARFRRLLVGIRPSQQIPVRPRASGEFQPKWQSIWIEAAGDHDSWNSQHVDPSSVAMRAIAKRSILWHGFVRWRHLYRGINKSIQVQ